MGGGLKRENKALIEMLTVGEKRYDTAPSLIGALETWTKRGRPPSVYANISHRVTLGTEKRFCFTNLSYLISSYCGR